MNNNKTQAMAGVLEKIFEKQYHEFPTEFEFNQFFPTLSKNQNMQTEEQGSDQTNPDVLPTMLWFCVDRTGKKAEKKI